MFEWKFIPAQIAIVDLNIPLIAKSSLISFTLFQIMTCRNRRRVLMFMNETDEMLVPIHIFIMNMRALKRFK